MELAAQVVPPVRGVFLLGLEDAVELDVVSLPEDYQSQTELPLVGVAASDQPVVERPAKSEEEQKGERDA